MPLTVWIDKLDQHFSTQTGEIKRRCGDPSFILIAVNISTIHALANSE
jgi:hypothetical protein